mgnify:CR=1 FL=1
MMNKSNDIHDIGAIFVVVAALGLFFVGWRWIIEVYSTTISILYVLGTGLLLLGLGTAKEMISDG